MIRMSRGQAAFCVSIMFAIALAGCCGTGPSHKCDFTPPGTTTDAGGSDAGLPCGTKFCTMTQVCCVKKAPLIALCIDPSEFVSAGCEKMDLPCVSPTNCPPGLLCCVELAPDPAVSCKPMQVCPGDGQNTYIVCDKDSDCPSQRIGSCQAAGSLDDGGTFAVCAPGS
jgi:hypothetical protein